MGFWPKSKHFDKISCIAARQLVKSKKVIAAAVRTISGIDVGLKKPSLPRKEKSHAH